MMNSAIARNTALLPTNSPISMSSPPEMSCGTRPRTQGMRKIQAKCPCANQPPLLVPPCAWNNHSLSPASSRSASNPSPAAPGGVVQPPFRRDPFRPRRPRHDPFLPPPAEPHRHLPAVIRYVQHIHRLGLEDHQRSRPRGRAMARGGGRPRRPSAQWRPFPECGSRPDAAAAPPRSPPPPAAPPGLPAPPPPRPTPPPRLGRGHDMPRTCRACTASVTGPQPQHVKARTRPPSRPASAPAGGGWRRASRPAVPAPPQSGPPRHPSATPRTAPAAPPASGAKPFAQCG